MIGMEFFRKKDKPPSTEKKTKQTRLRLLLAGIVALMIGACTDTDDSVTPPEPNSTATLYLGNSPVLDEPTPESTEKPELIFYDQNGIRVWARDGIPTRWESESGQTGQFDQQEMETALRTAQETGQVTIAAAHQLTVEYPDTETPEQETAETPTHIPEDILSQEELAHHGIEILSPQSLRLHLRPAAFDPGEALEQYQPESDQRLTIIVVDKPSLAAEHFQDPQFDQFREVIETHFYPITADRVQNALYQAIDYHAEQENISPNRVATLEKIADSISVEEAIAWGLSGTTNGYTLWQGHPNGLPDSALVLLAIGERPDVSYLTIHADPSGTFTCNTERIDFENDMGVRPSYPFRPDQSYPHPDDYQLLEEHPFGTVNWKLLALVDPRTKDPFFMIRHEFYHLWSLYQYEQGLQPDWERLEAYAEQEMDRRALESIRRATDRYRNSDDTGSYLVIENNQDLVVIG